MEYLNGQYYKEVKDHRYKIHPTENIILHKRDEPKSLRTQYQVQKEAQIRKNQKVNKNDNNQSVVKNYPKNKNKQPNIQKQIPNCPSCKRNNWLEFDKDYYCTNCDYIINKQKHQINKQVRRQDHDFSTRLNYANKKVREIFINMVNTNYISTEGMINKLQSLKGKTKLKFYKNLNNYIMFWNNKKPSNSRSRSLCQKRIKAITSKIYHEILLLMEFLQTKPDIRNMNINYYDLYYTVIKVRNENRDTDDNYQND